MRHRSRIVNLPIRVAAGAYILNSGLEKLKAEKETRERLHGFASGSYPVVENLEPEQFVTALGASEALLGGALLLPYVVRDELAGAALTAFSSALLGLYAKTPGLRKEASVRPTRDGTAIAKDSWIAGIGLTLMLSGLGSRRTSRVVHKAKQRRREARKATLLAVPAR